MRKQRFYPTYNIEGETDKYEKRQPFRIFKIRYRRGTFRRIGYGRQLFYVICDFTSHKRRQMAGFPLRHRRIYSRTYIELYPFEHIRIPQSGTAKKRQDRKSVYNIHRRRGHRIRLYPWTYTSRNTYYTGR